ncbi:MBL fold metallo-hydrolase [Actinomadura sp. ATCC 31491]|uniref:MBL fold metallo-hydrolase n=1 Tax=Actinomadura luzonensis TaxID=2805427 RepID=A0ABT0G3I0_9ACTN|nr:MBL fold metallo-hydrolase [Actinomadura luzonensis]MCK2218958.1 MBL fold metallo-hydrolase [Actinomadura luzonensis]
MAAACPRPVEIAPGVHRLETGRGLMEANVYLVHSSAGGLVVVDTAWAGRAPAVRRAAEAVARGRTEAVLLTHVHPDHSGAAAALARAWRVPVYLHPEELRFAPGRYLPEFAHPLDRRVVAPLMRLVPGRLREAARVEGSLEGLAVAYEPGRGVPFLPGWRCVPTPGHTPGHVAFFRPEDGLLISGDAVVTVELNAPLRFLRETRELSGPPRWTTWDWARAAASVRALAALPVRTLAPGHGRPLALDGAARLLALADRMERGRRARVRAAHDTGSGHRVTVWPVAASSSSAEASRPISSGRVSE